MIDSYDEDLTQNLWYISLCEKYTDLYSRATDERWMICIPRSGSWKNSIDDKELFSQKCFESHILKPVMVYSSDGSCSNTESENKFVTFNGKEVFIQGSKIVCGKGFSYNFNKPSFSKKSENLALNVESCHTSHIDFEETFFNENDESYIVLCISDPLEPHLVSHKSDVENDDKNPPTKPRREMYGSYLWERASNPVRLQQAIDEKISQFILHPKVYDENRNHAVIESEVKGTAEKVVNFLTTCHHIVLRDSKLKKLFEYPGQREPMKTAIEGYVLHGIHRTVTYNLNNLLAYQDCLLNKITRSLTSVTLSDLGVAEQFWSSIPRARRELSILNRCRTPREKLTCLQNAILCLLSMPKDRLQLPVDSPATTPVEDKSIGKDALAMRKRPNDSAAMSTDDLLPILIYLVIKCDIPNWLSNLEYLKHFNFSKTAQDKSWFHIATLEAALEHVRHEKIEVSKIGSFRKQNSSDKLEHYFMELKNGDVDLVKRMLRQAEEFRNLQEHDKCHPLCECNKCVRLTERKMTGSNREEISISSRDEKGRTPLHIVAITGKHELVHVLVSFGADLNSSDYHGATPLHLAAQEGNQSVIFLLLHYGSNPNAEDNNNNTPLHLSCLGGHETCVKALLYYDPAATVVKVNVANDVGDSPLHIASKWGYVNIVTCLVEYGADPHLTNKRKVTPFNVSHDSKVFDALKNTDFDNPRLVTHVKTTVSQKSVSSNKPSSKTGIRPLVVDKKKQPTEEDLAYKQVEKLLRAVADDDVNMVSYVCRWDDNARESPVKCHPLCQCFKCQPLSQDVCLHANSADRAGTTPLLIASKLGYVKMVELLLSHDAKVNVKSKQKAHSPLHLACQYGHIKIVEKLLDKGAMVDTRDADGNTPIYMCAMNGHVGCINMLLQHDASVNLRNHRKDSPLHEAVRWKHYDTACLLIQHGALTYYKNTKGQTALDLAKEDKELYDLLSKALEENDIFKGADAASVEEQQKTVENNRNKTSIQPNKPSCHTSLSRSEADELIADDLYENSQKLRSPPTPPMIEANIFDDDEEDTADNARDNLCLDLQSLSLNSKTPENRFTNISNTIESLSALQRIDSVDLPQLSHDKPTTSSGNDNTTPCLEGTSHLDSLPIIVSSSIQDSLVKDTIMKCNQSDIVLNASYSISSDVTSLSENTASMSLKPSVNDSSDFNANLENSESKASYFEITAQQQNDVVKPHTTDGRRLSTGNVNVDAIEELQYQEREIQVTRENKLKAENDYLSLNQSNPTSRPEFENGSYSCEARSCKIVK